jgi:hypothetical protein
MQGRIAYAPDLCRAGVCNTPLQIMAPVILMLTEHYCIANFESVTSVALKHMNFLVKFGILTHSFKIDKALLNPSCLLSGQ